MRESLDQSPFRTIWSGGRKKKKKKVWEEKGRNERRGLMGERNQWKKWRKSRRGGWEEEVRRKREGKGRDEVEEKAWP